MFVLISSLGAEESKFVYSSTASHTVTKGNFGPGKTSSKNMSIFLSSYGELLVRNKWGFGSTSCFVSYTAVQQVYFENPKAVL